MKNPPALTGGLLPHHQLSAGNAKLGRPPRNEPIDGLFAATLKVKEPVPRVLTRTFNERSSVAVLAQMKPRAHVGRRGSSERCRSRPARPGPWLEWSRRISAYSESKRPVALRGEDYRISVQVDRGGQDRREGRWLERRLWRRQRLLR